MWCLRLQAGGFPRRTDRSCNILLDRSSAAATPPAVKTGFFPDGCSDTFLTL